MYVDDTLLFSVNTNFSKAVLNLQEDINSLNIWCNKNGIMANTDKTKVMMFGSTTVLNKTSQPVIMMNAVPLKVVSVYKYLGVTLDSQLSYNSHLDRLISTVTAKLKQFQRMRGFLNTKVALLVYKNMMLPMLEYVFLSATSSINRRRLQVLQNKGLRCALNRDIDVCTDYIHIEANLLKLKYRREQHQLNFMFDQAQDSSKLKRRPGCTVNTRSSNKIFFFFFIFFFLNSVFETVQQST